MQPGMSDLINCFLVGSMIKELDIELMRAGGSSQTRRQNSSDTQLRAASNYSQNNYL